MSDIKSARQALEQRRSSMKNAMSTYIPGWKQARKYFLPSHGKFEGEPYGQDNVNRDSIINNTAEEAVSTLAAGFQSGVTNPARPWFNFIADDPDLNDFGPVKEYIHFVVRAIRDVYSRSNIYRVLPHAYRELAAFGIAAPSIMADREHIVRAYNFTIGEYMIGSSHRNVVDTVYRDFEYTVWQTVQKFGLKSISSVVKAQWDNGEYSEKVGITHSIEPNAKKLEGISPILQRMPFRSIYYENGTNDKRHGKFLSVGGFTELPVMVPRWDTVSTDVWGNDHPGQRSMGDTLELQHLELMKARAVENQADPAMIAPASAEQAEVSTLPGDVTYVDTTAGQFGAAFNVNFDMSGVVLGIGEIEARINRSWHVDLFRMISDLDKSNVTATEIDERKAEKISQIGPVHERINTELLGPMLRRTFNIMSERGLLPPAPEELQGRELNIEFIGIMAIAQKAVAVGGIEKLMRYATELSAARAAGDPEVWDKFNHDQSMEDVADSLGVNPKILVPTDDVEVLREQRAQQQLVQQAAELGESAAGTAQSLANTPIGSGTALENIASAAGIG